MLQPFTSHENYDKYIQRIVQGESDVMFPGQPDYFAVTSGTSSGKSRPYPRQLVSDLQRLMIHNVHTKRKLLDVANVGKLKFWLDVRAAAIFTRTPSGVRRGPLSAAGAFICPFRPSPDAAYEIRQEQASLYVHALFGLTCKDVTLLSCLTAPTALNFFRVIETRWEAMCDDIEHGNICKCPGLQDDVRIKLQKHLTADAERAGELRCIFKEGFHNIGPRVWPCLSVVHTAASGTYIPAVNILRQKYLVDIPITSSKHMASEGLYGANMNIIDQMKTEYTILPDHMFYEFIHEVDVDQDNPQSLLAHEVDIGQSYEMVITNWSGLYRYRTGDIIRVTSFTGQAPNYVLQQRKGDGYGMYPEFLFTEAVSKASRTWTSGTMFNYMAVGNFIVEELTGEISTTAHVYVFIEMLGDGALTDREKHMIDESLQETQDGYKWLRCHGNYAPAVVVQVRPGTLEEVKKIYMKLNPDLHAQQFKYPKFIKHKDVVACLLSHRLKSTS
ncbi:indole-3-acetic acid-amido synthetase GH3.8-like [Haliotis rubra]|uniref:indole-3-acetic acid-amido synthetase GH3.8-like n=1 Tax=Haliotis rubra TaxID=36100 RepID=UPI001EE5CDCC|nr:indole-3-acetic acid-amido synthetase GH3.8-like [Haliotis rubra]